MENKFLFDILELLKKFHRHGFCAYIVGGYVRDSLLNINSKDFDIATNANPSELIDIFKSDVIDTSNIKYGMVKIKWHEKIFEITSFRKEGEYLNNRKPVEVYFTQSFDEDLRRRDFTINAMAIDYKGNLIDKYNGYGDLKNRTLRTIGKADDRLKEDALRILRAIRFCGKLNLKMDDELYESILKNKELIKNLSKERIQSEFNKILLLDKPSISLRIMADMGIIEILFLELHRTIAYEQKNPYHSKNLFEHIIETVDNTGPSIDVRLAALFHDVGKVETQSFDENGIAYYYKHSEISAEIAKKILKKYKYSNKIIENVEILILEHMKVSSEMTDKALRRQVQRVGDKRIYKLYDLLIADRMATLENRDVGFLIERKTRIEELLKENFNKKDFLKVNGKDIMTLGFKEGKIVGEILNFLKDLVIEDISLNEREILLDIVKKNFK